MNRMEKLRRLICAITLVLSSSAALSATFLQKDFATPDAAVALLADAVKANDQKTLQEIFGKHGSSLLDSGDKSVDKKNRDDFIKAYEQSHHLVYVGETRAELQIGDNQWSLPIPLVSNKGRWKFDTTSGKEEIMYRRIGRNELATIQVCLAIVDAEREYASQDWDGDGLLKYAAKFVSAPGKKDGLYWESKEGEPLSPLGPLLAAAARDGYKKTSGKQPLENYHGYLYRILTSQGDAASGGSYDYSVNGKLIGGFAVVAYPAHYGSSGIMSFIINHDGVVYEKDLGKDTAKVASSLNTFNPDASWKKQE